LTDFTLVTKLGDRMNAGEMVMGHAIGIGDARKVKMDSEPPPIELDANRTYLRAPMGKLLSYRRGIQERTVGRRFQRLHSGFADMTK
jgi:hypothetical protein